MKNSYIAIAIIILIAILGFILANRNSQAPEVVNTSNRTKTVFSDGVYKLNISSSSISWHGESLGHSQKGFITLQSGNFVISANKIKKGEFVIDMNSIKSIPNIEKLVNHLKGTDFFDVTKYPTAKFVFKNIIPLNREDNQVGKYIINGDLTIKDISRPISFFAIINGNENSLRAIASFSINRADWEIKYNSPTFFDNLGDKAINDIITIGLDLNAQKVIQ